jgi:hypothetical protein
MHFIAQGDSPLQYNNGTFNANNGTIEFNGRHGTVAPQLTLELNNVNINMGNPGYYFVVDTTNGDFNVNGTLTLTNGHLGAALITAKGDVLVKSTFNYWNRNQGDFGIIRTSGNVTVTAEADSISPTIELNTGSTMNVDDAGASIIQLILNGGTFNAPTGTMKFLAQGDSPLQYNNGTFNANNGTAEFIGRHGTVAPKLPLELNNVNINMGNPSYYFVVDTTNGDFNVNGTLTLTNGNLGSAASDTNVMNAKGDVLVKSTFNGGGGEIKTSANTTVTAEAGSISPDIELNAGAVMNVDNAGASIDQLILNGGIFNAPTGTMKFTAKAQGGWG